MLRSVAAVRDGPTRPCDARRLLGGLQPGVALRDLLGVDELGQIGLVRYVEEHRDAPDGEGHSVELPQRQHPGDERERECQQQDLNGDERQSEADELHAEHRDGVAQPEEPEVPVAEEAHPGGAVADVYDMERGITQGLQQPTLPPRPGSGRAPWPGTPRPVGCSVALWHELLVSP